VAEWKSIEQKIEEQDEVDMADAECNLLDPDSENSPASQRLLLIREQHHIDLHLGHCQFYDFNYSSYLEARKVTSSNEKSTGPMSPFEKS